MKREYAYTDEELLREAGELLAERRLAEFEERMGEEHRFSPRFERRAKKLFARRGGWAARPASGSRRWSVRMAAAAMILLLLSVAAGAFGAAGGFARISVKTALPERFAFSFIRNEDTQAVVKASSDRPGWLPAGFSVRQDNSQNDLIALVYEKDPKNSWIIYTRFDVLADDEENLGSVELASSGDHTLRVETVVIGPYEGVLTNFVEKADGRTTILSLHWVDPEHRYELVGQGITRDEILRMAQSIY